MNNAWESYCLLIETNPSPSPVPDTPFSFPLSLPLPFPAPPFSLSPGYTVSRSLPFSLCRTAFPFYPSPFSTEPHRRRLHRLHRRRRAPPNRPVQMRAALSLYPRIKRIVYDKSSGSSLTKRPVGPLRNAGGRGGGGRPPVFTCVERTTYRSVTISPIYISDATRKGASDKEIGVTRYFPAVFPA